MPPTTSGPTQLHSSRVSLTDLDGDPIDLPCSSAAQVVSPGAEIVTVTLGLAADIETNGFRADRPSPIWVLIALATPVYFVRRLARHRRVAAGTMMGAIAAYLLIAVGYV